MVEGMGCRCVFFHHPFLRYGGASNEIAMFGFGLATFATGPGFQGWHSIGKIDVATSRPIQHIFT